MGLDVANALFGSFHVSWGGARGLSVWCMENGLPYLFIGWESGFNDGDRCRLGPGRKHQKEAQEWCTRLEEKVPEVAEIGRQLLEYPPDDLYMFLYPTEQPQPAAEFGRRAIAAWYALLQNGIKHRDTLEYW
jgi:hypothetical protein